MDKSDELLYGSSQTTTDRYGCDKYPVIFIRNQAEDDCFVPALSIGQPTNSDLSFSTLVVICHEEKALRWNRRIHSDTAAFLIPSGPNGFGLSTDQRK
jgi:hypothetical protein